jgi:hypothetical protein
MNSPRAALLTGFLSIAVLGLIFTTVCCSKGDEAPPPRTPTPLDLSDAGTIRGTVFFSGTPPQRRLIAAGGDKACASAEVADESAVVLPAGDKHVVKHAFVWIESGLGDKVFAVPSEPVVVDQKNCVFVPHVAGVQRHQYLVFRNSDPTQHNMNFVEPGQNPGHNFSLAREGLEAKLWFPHEAIPMKVICNAHSWMTMWIGCVDHPYYSVTGDDGAFNLAARQKVPPGRYKVACWTERFGRKSADVEVTPRGDATCDFTVGK